MFTDPCAASKPFASKGQLKKFDATQSIKQLPGPISVANSTDP